MSSAKPTCTFFDLLVKSNLTTSLLTKMLSDAYQRLDCHRRLVDCTVDTDSLYPLHVTHFNQTTMEIDVLQTLVIYERFMNEGRTTTIEELQSSTTSPITNPHDFSSEGIRQMVESIVPSSRARQQLITYISELQISTLVHSSQSDSAAAAHHSNETLLFQDANEMRREQLAKVQGSLHSPNSASISHGRKSSSNEHQHPRHGSLAEDFDSNVSSHSASSIIHHEAGIEQPKHFDSKRRWLAAEQQQLPTSEVDSSPMMKKVCLDDINDSFDEKAQAGRDEDEEARTNDTMDDRHE